MHVDGHRLFRYLAIAAFAVCYVTILLGGNVMASDSGLACPDWPTCHGTVFPALTGATGIEWTHRLSAFVLSLATAALAVAALLFERGRPALLRLSVGAAIAVVAQALLGGLVVESDLAILVVLLHFALATVLFGLLLILAFVANWKSLPARWLEWARSAGDELPASERLQRDEAGRGSPATGAPTGGAAPPARAG